MILVDKLKFVLIVALQLCCSTATLVCGGASFALCGTTVAFCGAAMADSGSVTETEPEQETKDIRSYTITTDLVRPNKVGIAGREVVVVTPPGYDDPANQNQCYPVMYLLHGSPGKPWNFIYHGSWQNAVAKMASENLIIPPILVMPDGNYTSEKHGDCEWVNSADGRDKFMDYVCKDVVDWTDAHFRTIALPAGRIIGGVSEGAYGAVNIGLRHPEVFGNVLALSGYYTNDGSGWARPIMGNDPKYILENSPLQYVPIDYKSQPIDWTHTRFFLGAGDSENRYTTETRSLAAMLLQKGAEVHLQISKGNHGWALWHQLFAAGTEILLAKTEQKMPATEVAHAQGPITP